MSKNIELVKLENLPTAPNYLRPEVIPDGWQEIDGWDNGSHAVRILWMNDADGTDNFLLDLIPKAERIFSVSTDVTLEEVQQVRRERHAYSYVAPKAGHIATVRALGIPEEA